MGTGRRGRKSSETGLRVLLCALLGLVALAVNALAAEPKLEYEVKAAFLLNFTRFIEWPASAFESANSPFAICVMGDDPFGNTLDQVVEGESVGGHRLVAQRIDRAPAPKECQVLFVRKTGKDVAAILADIGPGVLTVSDQDGFLREGGMIAFVIEDRHVRFDINLRAAVRASLTMSSRLLNVARFVQK
jgi:hypothetical protein